MGNSTFLSFGVSSAVSIAHNLLQVVNAFVADRENLLYLSYIDDTLIQKKPNSPPNYCPLLERYNKLGFFISKSKLQSGSVVDFLGYWKVVEKVYRSIMDISLLSCMIYIIFYQQLPFIPSTSKIKLSKSRKAPWTRLYLNFSLLSLSVWINLVFKLPMTTSKASSAALSSCLILV